MDLLAEKKYFFSHCSNIGSSSHVIPAISGKVGIAYCGCLGRGYKIMIEAGFRGDQYFNAVNDVAYQQLLAGDDINSNSNYQDFNLNGPYFCLILRA